MFAIESGGDAHNAKVKYICQKNQCSRSTSTQTEISQTLQTKNTTNNDEIDVSKGPTNYKTNLTISR